jgi:signal recognition particle receptor subunit beta
MSSVNPITKEILLKVVYYGPGLGGKTTTLQHIHKTTPDDRRGKMVSLATPVDRTLYFDFLPVELPKINNYTLRLHIFTVPGQVYFNATRKLVLNGADGVVFVADSQTNRMDANKESLDNLKENLQEQRAKSSADDVPIIMQYNKRDLPNILSVDDMEAQLNPDGLPWIATSAINGDGVHSSLALITKEILRNLKKRDGLIPDMKERSEMLDAKIAFSREESGINDTVANFSRTSGMAEPAAALSPLPASKEGDSLSMVLPVGPDTAKFVSSSFHEDIAGDFSDDPPDELPSLQDMELGHEIGALTAPNIAVPDLTDEMEDDPEMEPEPKPEREKAHEPKTEPLDPDAYTRPGINRQTVAEALNFQSVPPHVPLSKTEEEKTATHNRRPDRPTIPSPASSSNAVPRTSLAELSEQGLNLTSGLSFSSLWPFPQRSISESIERLLNDGQDHQAMLDIWKEIGRLLDMAKETLPDLPRESVVVLLGLDGRKYVEAARLAQMARLEKPLSRTALLKAYLLLLNLVAALDA